MANHRTFRGALLSATVLAGLVGLAAPASAATPDAPKPRLLPKPDGLIAKGLAGTAVGNDIFNTTAVGQAVGGSAKAGKTLTFVITISNDGPGTARLRAQAAGSSAGFRVKYLSGSTDVTAAVVDGTFATGILGAGQSEVLVAKVTVRSSTVIGAKTSRLVTISGGPVSAQLVDAVKFTAKRK